MGASVSDIEALAEPLVKRAYVIFFNLIDKKLNILKDSKVFFAGEATSSNFVSTVHGAYQSGIREARNIIGTIQKN